MKKVIKKIFEPILRMFPIYRTIRETRGTQTPVTWRLWIFQKVLGFNRRAYWPMHFTSIVTGVKNIYAGIETAPGYMPGCYIQGIGSLYIGDYTQISANVGLITSNHLPHDSRQHAIGKIRIGKYCWIGMNAIILPNVKLGDFTIVGAGSVVTKSFEDGYCIIGGNPARVIRKLNKEEMISHRSEFEYNGYVAARNFDNFAKMHLNIEQW